MSFSILAREIRDLVYHALLCPPAGIQLQLGHERWSREEDYDYEDLDEEEDKEEEKEEEEVGDFDQRGISNLIPSAVTRIPTAIFHVNCQIRQEAAEVFYGFNRFTFDNGGRTTLNFLRGLRPSCRRRIKNVGFTISSTYADDGGCTRYWCRLCSFISRNMDVDSVTIQVPPDSIHGIDETKEARRAPDSEWYWWPAAHLLTSSLMAGKIQKVRIGYSGTLKIRAPGEEARSQHENSLESLENLDSVHLLRYPRSPEELRRESCERKNFMRALNKGRLHKFTSRGALEADLLTRRQRFDFTVAREDDPIGEVGTVLVLTRPSPT